MLQNHTDSYSTTIGSSFDTRQVIGAIKNAVIIDDLENQKENTLGVQPFAGLHSLFITGTYPSEKQVPNFPHPISVKGIRGKNFICSDLRLVLRENKGGAFEDRVKNVPEFNFLMTRHKLALLWAADRRSEFRTSLAFGAFAFSTWLANAIGHLKSLDNAQRIQTQIVLLCYYYDLTSSEEAKKEGMYRSGQIPWVRRLMGDSVRDLDTVVLSVGKEPMNTLSDAVERIKKVLDSVLLVNLNDGVLLASVKGHWFGQGMEPQKIIGVAVEDPPTWCALVKSVLDYSGYKNSMLAQTVTKLGKRGEADSFSSSMNTLFETTLRVESIAGMVSELPDSLDTNYSVEELVYRAEQLPKLIPFEKEAPNEQ